MGGKPEKRVALQDAPPYRWGQDAIKIKAESSCRDPQWPPRPHQLRTCRAHVRAAGRDPRVSRVRD